MPSDVYDSVTSAFGQDTDNISGLLPKPRKPKRRPAGPPPSIPQIPTRPRPDPRAIELEEQNRQLRTLAEGMSGEIEDLRGTQILSEFVAAEQERMGGEVEELASRQAFEAYIDGVIEGVGVQGGTTRGGQRERAGVSHDTNWEAVGLLIETVLTGGVRTIASNVGYEAALWALKKSNLPAPLEVGIEAMIAAAALKKGKIRPKGLMKAGGIGTGLGGVASAAGVGQGTSELLGGLLAAGLVEAPIGFGRTALTDRGQALGEAVETINVRQGPSILSRRGGDGLRGFEPRIQGQVLDPALDFGPGRAGNVRSALGGVTERPTAILDNTRFGPGGGFLRNVHTNEGGRGLHDIEGNLIGGPLKRVFEAGNYRYIVRNSKRASEAFSKFMEGDRRKQSIRRDSNGRPLIFQDGPADPDGWGPRGRSEGRVVDNPNYGKESDVTAEGVPGVNKVQFKVVEMDSLVASNDHRTFAVNPDFPEELQPRDRTRVMSQDQVRKNAGQLDPHRVLTDFRSLERGAPVVTSDNVVFAGNNRAMMFRIAKDDVPDRYNAYVDSLKERAEEFGLTSGAISNMKAPVLVRELDMEGMAQEQIIALAHASNVPVAAVMAATETAALDSQGIGVDLINKLIPGSGSLADSIRATRNQEFVREFVATLPATERTGLYDAAAKGLSQDGLRRIEGAIFARAYGGEAGARLFNQFFESADPQVQNLMNSMRNAAPKILRSEDLVQRGLRDPELSIVEDFTIAADRFARIKMSGRDVETALHQADFTEGALLTEEQIAIIRMLETNTRKPRLVRAFLDKFADAVEASPPPDQTQMFAAEVGESTVHSRDAIFNQALRASLDADEIAEQTALGVPRQFGDTAGGTTPFGEPPAPALGAADDVTGGGLQGIPRVSLAQADAASKYKYTGLPGEDTAGGAQGQLDRILASDDEFITVFHGTNEAGAEGIIRSGRVGGDMGGGINLSYSTASGFATRSPRSGGARVVLQFDIPREEFRKFVPEGGGRGHDEFLFNPEAAAALRGDLDELSAAGTQKAFDVNKSSIKVVDPDAATPATPPVRAADERITVDLSTPDRSGRFEFEDANASAFINDVEAQVVDDVNIEMLPSGPNRVYFIRLESLVQQEGAGTRVLKQITDLADEQGITIVGSAVPTGAAGGPGSSIISVRKLKAFYRKAGFVFEDPDDPASMAYHPREATGIHKGPPVKPGVRGISRDVDTNLNGREVEYTGESETHPGGVTWYSVRDVLDDGTLADNVQHIQTPPPTTAAAPGPPAAAAGSEYGWPATNPNPSTVVDAGDLEFGEVIYLTIPEPGEHYRLTGQRQPKPYKVDRINGSLVDLDPIGPEGGLSAGFTLDTSTNSPAFKNALFERTGRMYDPGVPPPPDPRSPAAIPASAAPAGPTVEIPDIGEGRFTGESVDGGKRSEPFQVGEEQVGGQTQAVWSQREEPVVFNQFEVISGPRAGETLWLPIGPDDLPMEPRPAWGGGTVSVLTQLENAFSENLNVAEVNARVGQLHEGLEGLHGRDFFGDIQDAGIPGLPRGQDVPFGTLPVGLTDPESLPYRVYDIAEDSRGNIIHPQSFTEKSEGVRAKMHQWLDESREKIRVFDERVGIENGIISRDVAARLTPQDLEEIQQLDEGLTLLKTKRKAGLNINERSYNEEVRRPFVTRENQIKRLLDQEAAPRTYPPHFTVEEVNASLYPQPRQAATTPPDAPAAAAPQRSAEVEKLIQDARENGYTEFVEEAQRSKKLSKGQKKAKDRAGRIAIEKGDFIENEVVFHPDPYVEYPAGWISHIDDDGTATISFTNKSGNRAKAPRHADLGEGFTRDNTGTLTAVANGNPWITTGQPYREGIVKTDNIAKGRRKSIGYRTAWPRRPIRAGLPGAPRFTHIEDDRFATDRLRQTVGYGRTQDPTDLMEDRAKAIFQIEQNPNSTLRQIDDEIAADPNPISRVFWQVNVQDRRALQALDPDHLEGTGKRGPNKTEREFNEQIDRPAEERLALIDSGFQKALRGRIDPRTRMITGQIDESLERPRADAPDAEIPDRRPDTPEPEALPGERSPLIPPSVRKELLVSAETILQGSDSEDLIAFARELNRGAGKRASQGTDSYLFSDRGLVGLFREVENVLNKIEGGLEIGTKRQTVALHERFTKLRDELPQFDMADRGRLPGSPQRLTEAAPVDTPVTPRVMEPIAEFAQTTTQATRRPSQYALPRVLSKSNVNYKNTKLDFDSDFDRALYISTSKRASTRRSEFVDSLNEFLPDDVPYREAAIPVREAVTAAMRSAPDAERVRIPAVHTEMPTPSTLRVRTDVAAPIEGQPPIGPVGGVDVGPIARQEPLEPRPPGPTGPPPAPVGPIPQQGRNIERPGADITMRSDLPYDPDAYPPGQRPFGGQGGQQGALEGPGSQPPVPGRDTGPVAGAGPVPLPDASGSTARSPLRRQIELEGPARPVREYPAPRIQQARRMPDGSLEAIPDPIVATAGPSTTSDGRMILANSEPHPQTVRPDVATPEEALDELKGLHWDIRLPDSEMDVRASRYHQTSNLDDYFGSYPRTVQRGLEGVSDDISPPDDLVLPREFTSGRNSMEDVSPTTGQTSDPGRLVDAIDKGHSNGPLARTFWYPTIKTSEASQKFADAGGWRIQQLGERLDITTNKQKNMAGRIIEFINAEDANLDPAELLKRENIRQAFDIEKGRGFQGSERTNIIAYAQDIRKFFDETLESMNKARAYRGETPIGRLEYYRPWSIDANSFYVPENGPGGLPDFLADAANGPFNPRAQHRRKNTPHSWGDLNENLEQLAGDYVRTASKEIFYKDIVRNGRAHTKQLREWNMPNASKAVDNYISEVYASQPAAFTQGISFIPSKSRRAAVGIKRRFMRSVFPLNFQWNIFVQTGSTALTVARYGAINTVKGMDYLYNPKVREETQQLAHSVIQKKRSSGRISVQDSSGIEQSEVIRNPNRLLANYDRVTDWANFLTDAMEDALTGVSVRAAYHRGVEMGFEGRGLWQFASDGGGRTQSMYNMADTVGLLRSPELGTVIPFQTFAFETFNNVRELNVIYLRNVIGKTGAYETLSATSAKGKATRDQRLWIAGRFIAAAVAMNVVADRAIDRKPWQLSSFIPFWAVLSGGANPGNPFNEPFLRTYSADLYQGINALVEYHNWKPLRDWAMRYNLVGGSQILRTIQGIEATADGEFRSGAKPYGVPKFEVNDSPSAVERMKAYALGVYATEGGQEYLDRVKRSEGPFEKFIGFGLSVGGGKLGGLERQWMGGWDEYYEIKGSAEAREAAGQLRNREGYRKNNPDIDAQLFLIGKVETLKTTKAKELARDWIKEHDLTKRNRLLEFVIGDVDDDLLETWDTVLDFEKSGIGVEEDSEAFEEETIPAPTNTDSGRDFFPRSPQPAPQPAPQSAPQPAPHQQTRIPEPGRQPGQPWRADVFDSPASSVIPQGTPNTVAQSAQESPGRQWEAVQADLSGDDLRALQRVWAGGFLSPEEENKLKVVHQNHQLGEPNFNAWLKRRLRQIQTNAAVDAVRA